MSPFGRNQGVDKARCLSRVGIGLLHFGFKSILRCDGARWWDFASYSLRIATPSHHNHHPCPRSGSACWEHCREFFCRGVMAQVCYILGQNIPSPAASIYCSNSDKKIPGNAPNKPNHSWDMGDDCDGMGWISSNAMKRNPTISLHHNAKLI